MLAVAVFVAALIVICVVFAYLGWLWSKQMDRDKATAEQRLPDITELTLGLKGEGVLICECRYHDQPKAIELDSGLSAIETYLTLLDALGSSFKESKFRYAAPAARRKVPSLADVVALPDAWPN